MITRKWNLFFILILLIAFSSCSWLNNKDGGIFGQSDSYFGKIPTPTSETPIYQKYNCISLSETPETGFVIEVIDGDSIKAKIGEDVFEIRYIGMNTPEYYSNERTEAERATIENKGLVEGKKIYLFKDRSNTDKYHRLLRYVFTDEYFVNLEMIKQGSAEPRSYPPDTSCQVLFNKAAQ